MNKYLLSIFFLGLMMVSCQSNKTGAVNNTYGIDGVDEDMAEANVNDVKKMEIGKGVCRIQGTVLSVVAEESREEESYVFKFQINEIVAFGPNFSTYRPRQDEILIIAANEKNQDFGPGDDIILDIISTMEKRETEDFQRASLVRFIRKD